MNSRDGDAAPVLSAPRRGSEADCLVIRGEHTLDPHGLVRVLNSGTLASDKLCLVLTELICTG